MFSRFPFLFFSIHPYFSFFLLFSNSSYFLYSGWLIIRSAFLLLFVLMIFFVSFTSSCFSVFCLSCLRLIFSHIVSGLPSDLQGFSCSFLLVLYVDCFGSFSILLLLRFNLIYLFLFHLWLLLVHLIQPRSLVLFLFFLILTLSSFTCFRTNIIIS